MALIKGTYVKHPKKSEWGVGIVIEDERVGEVPVFFENEANIKKIRLEFVDLTVMDEPGDARIYLENLLVEQYSNGRIDRKPFPEKVKNFLEVFSGGLHGQVIETHERQYKVDAHHKWQELLSEDEFRRLLSDEDWSELTKRIKSCYTINLISTFEAIKFADALKNLDAQQDIARALFNLLYGGDAMQKRFLAYVSVLAKHECDKWPLATLPLYLRFPKQYMFVKPTVTQEAAANRGFDIQYSSQVNWNTYKHVLMFSNDLKQRLDAYGNPALTTRDMIDVQNFMWCSFTDGWSVSEVRKAELELSRSKGN